MIKDKEVKLHITARNITKYRKLGYDCSINSDIYVKIEHLAPTSEVRITALCDSCGVVCDIVSNDNHAWNRMMIDNEWLYIDATWDDCTGSKKYFMLPEDEFYKVHPKHTDVDKDVWAK